MLRIDVTYLPGIAVMTGACFALALQNLLIRKGTDTGRAYDAVLVVMATNIVVLVPAVGVYYYPEYALGTRSVLAFVGAGVAGTMVGRAFKYHSIERIGASRTAPVVNSNILVATVLGVVVLGERILPVHVLAILAIVAGVVVISWETTQENPHELSRRKLLVGLLVPLGAALAYGVEPIFATHGLNTGTPAPVGAAVKTVAATAGFVAYLRATNNVPSATGIETSELTYFVLAGLGNTAFVLGLYVALGVAPVSVVVPLLPTSTLFTVALSALFMPQRLEYITPRLVGAACVIVTGVVGLTVTS